MAPRLYPKNRDHSKVNCTIVWARDSKESARSNEDLPRSAVKAVEVALLLQLLVSLMFTVNSSLADCI